MSRLGHRPLDPRIVNVAIDGNALNRDGINRNRDALVDRLLSLSAAGTIRLVIPKGVKAELDAPETPTDKRNAVSGAIFSLPVPLSSGEQHLLEAITRELQGNAMSPRHVADADHLFEAAKYGGYFITHDQRILKRAGRLAVLPPSLTVVTLADFFEFFDQYGAQSSSRR